MVDLLEPLELGGVKQWIHVRGERGDLPILLFLHGGPGVTQMGFAHSFQRTWEKHFLVVHWDQRGGGKSFRWTTPGMTFEQFVSDTLELSRWLLARFDQPKLYLFGHSWGGSIGAHATYRAPELFHAFIGQGVLIHGRENERLALGGLKGHLDGLKDELAERGLERLGAPLHRGRGRGLFTSQWRALRSGGLFHDKGRWGVYTRAMFASPTYSLLDVLAYPLGVALSVRALWEEVLNVDLYRDVPRLEVPFLSLMGRFDTVTPRVLAEEYFEGLSAPEKQFVWFERSAHCPHLEEPEAVGRVLAEALLGVRRVGDKVA